MRPGGAAHIVPGARPGGNVGAWPGARKESRLVRGLAGLWGHAWWAEGAVSVRSLSEVVSAVSVQFLTGCCGKWSGTEDSGWKF